MPIDVPSFSRSYNANYGTMTYQLQLGSWNTMLGAVLECEYTGGTRYCSISPAIVSLSLPAPTSWRQWRRGAYLKTVATLAWASNRSDPKLAEPSTQMPPLLMVCCPRRGRMVPACTHAAPRTSASPPQGTCARPYYPHSIPELVALLLLQVYLQNKYSILDPTLLLAGLLRTAP